MEFSLISSRFPNPSLSSLPATNLNFLSPNSQSPTLRSFPFSFCNPKIRSRKNGYFLCRPIRVQSSDQNLRTRTDEVDHDDDDDDDGFVLEDVPHLTNYLPDLPSYQNPLKKSQAYVKIVVQKDSPRGVHFPRAGPREKVYFKSEEVRAGIVTCGGLCPGINTVIREIVCGLNFMEAIEAFILKIPCN